MKEDIQLTDSAAKQLAFLKNKHQNNNLYLRLFVEGGGCSGFKYILKIEDLPLQDELVFENQGEKLVIDDVSFDLLKGSYVDYIEDLTSAQFVIKNPNAATKCGCGNSFSL